MDLSIILTIGKYALLAGLYLFLFVVFRGMVRQLAAESAHPPELEQRARVVRASAPPARRRVVPPAVAAARPPAEAAPAAEQQPAAAAPVPAQGPLRPAAPRAQPAAPLAAAHPAQAYLRVVDSGAEGLEDGALVPLSAAVTIGRSSENSLPLSDRFVSTRHALICLRDGRRILVDRGSTNGTFVNGVRVDGEVELCDGDRIAMGNTVFEYHSG
ncbi:MAG: FHA domain-containing protein [Armatimonadota bacterium]